MSILNINKADEVEDMNSQIPVTKGVRYNEIYNDPEVVDSYEEVNPNALRSDLDVGPTRSRSDGMLTLGKDLVGFDDLGVEYDYGEHDDEFGGWEFQEDYYQLGDTNVPTRPVGYTD
jgi:hypothetical protein